MKKIFLISMLAMPGFLLAQEKESKEAERIIITKKGNDKEKLNIVVDGEEIIVNGKPLKDDENGKITVKRIKIKDLDSYREWPSADFNVRSFSLPSTNKAMLGVMTEKVEEGAKIISVNEESAAEKAGLKVGDIIVAVDSEKITTPDELSKALKDKEPGDKVNISYIRDGKKNTVTATLTKWKAPQAMTFEGFPRIEMRELFDRIPQNLRDGSRNIIIRGFSDNTPKLGIEIQDLEKGSGVKIIKVQKDSDASKAGLKEGDIIKEANGNTISTTDDMLAQMRKSRSGDTLKLKVDRNGRTENVEVHLSKKIKTATL